MDFTTVVGLASLASAGFAAIQIIQTERNNRQTNSPALSDRIFSIREAQINNQCGELWLRLRPLARPHVDSAEDVFKRALEVCPGNEHAERDRAERGLRDVERIRRTNGW